jgi:hypothetical protein
MEWLDERNGDRSDATRECETIIIFIGAELLRFYVGVSSLHASCHTYVMRSQHKHSSALSLLHVRLAVLEQALPDERFTE